MFASNNNNNTTNATPHTILHIKKVTEKRANENQNTTTTKLKFYFTVFIKHKLCNSAAFDFLVVFTNFLFLLKWLHFYLIVIVFIAVCCSKPDEQKPTMRDSHEKRTERQVQVATKQLV